MRRVQERRRALHRRRRRRRRRRFLSGWRGRRRCDPQQSLALHVQSFVPGHHGGLQLDLVQTPIVVELRVDDGAALVWAAAGHVCALLQTPLLPPVATRCRGLVGTARLRDLPHPGCDLAAACLAAGWRHAARAELARAIAEPLICGNSGTPPNSGML
jgi:hypothetical protein